jgi:hypothetical protein
MRIDRTTFLALTATIAGAAGCSSSSSSAQVDGGSPQADASTQPEAAAAVADAGAQVDAGGDAASCAVPCGGNCCQGKTACHIDSLGNKNCVPTCTDSLGCPTASPCCAYSPASDAGSGICLPSPTAEGYCLCSEVEGCTNPALGGGCCAPLTNPTGNPTGPYVCKPTGGASAGAAYYCTSCTAPACASGYCAVTVGGNCICELPCQNSSQCGGQNCSTLTGGACLGAMGACTAPANP